MNTEEQQMQREAMHMQKEEMRLNIIKAIKTVYDPEISVDIYDLGLIYFITIDDDYKVEVIMTLTSPACPAAGMLPQEVDDKVREVENVKDVSVDITFDPPWDQSMMSEEARLELGFM